MPKSNLLYTIKMLPYYIYFRSKYILLLIAFAVIIVSICIIYTYTKTPTYSDELIAIDSLCNDTPTTAKKQITKYKHTHKNRLNTDEIWYLRFLKFKLNVKQLKNINNDNEARTLLNHFESEADENVLKQLYYYVGTLYQLLGDAPKAMDYCHKGLSLIPETTETEQLRGLYYYLLSYVMTYQHLDKEALNIQSKSLDIYKRHKNYRRMIYSYISISWSLKNLDSLEQSIQSLKFAKTLAYKHDLEELVPTLNCQIAERYYELQKYRLAEKYINIALPKIPDVDKSSALNIAADIYAALGNTEKTKKFYYDILKYDNIYSKQNAYKFLTIYYKNNDDIAKAYEYSLKYCATTDTIVQLTASEYSAQANATFNYKYIEKDRNYLQQSIRKRDTTMGITILVTVIILCIIIVYWYRNKKRQKILCAMLEEIQHKSEDTIEKQKKELYEIRKKLNHKENETHEILKRYEQKEKQLEKLLDRNELLKKVSLSAESFFYETPIYRELKNACREPETVTADTVDWKLLEDTLFDIFPTFHEGMMKFKRMKEQAFHVCLLVKAGFNVQEISYLTIKTNEAINSTRRRLYETNFGKKGKPSEWDEIIRSL